MFGKDLREFGVPLACKQVCAPGAAYFLASPILAENNTCDRSETGVGDGNISCKASPTSLPFHFVEKESR